MSLWEWAAMTGGVAKANTPENERLVSTSEAAEVAAWLDAAPVWTRH